MRNEMNAAARDAAKTAVDSAMRDLKTMQYQMLKLEAERWEKDGYGGNALWTYSRMLEFATAFLPDIRVPEVLDQMLRLLKQEKIVGLHGGHVRAITEALSALPKEFSPDVDTIQQLIRATRAK